jgi:hypothetical protein
MYFSLLSASQHIITRNQAAAAKIMKVNLPASETMTYDMVRAIARQDVTMVGIFPINLLFRWQNITVMAISKLENVFIKIEGFY